MKLEDLLRHSVASEPDRLAVGHGPDAVTYAELWSRVCSIVEQLAPVIEPRDRVLICTAKSIDAVAAMQAVLVLGAVYVPVDHRMPPARAQVIAEDCDPAVCLVDAGSAGMLRGTDTVVELEKLAQSASVTHWQSIGNENDLACLLYTSGSTGKPKGVALTHRNALAFVEWAVTEIEISARDRLSSHAPFTFDLSILDLYGAFARAASVHLIDTDFAYAPDKLVDYLYDHQITVWYSVPSALGLMVEYGALVDRGAPKSLRAVLVAGEPCPTPLLRKLRQSTSARFLNLYGPTETNVCTFREISDADLARDVPPPIGVAASGDTVWAELEGSVVSTPGAEGELVVAGPTVMHGYWGAEPHRGLYRTGDIVRLRDDGAYDFVGRRDHMVKVRGHRVELGDVEAAVLAHPVVDEVAVTVEGSGATAAIVAYVRGTDHGPTLLSLKAFCAERLSHYMIPDRLHRLQEFPRTFNGKIDRKALSAS